MFAGRNRLVRLPVADGLQVRVTGRVSLYEPRGDFQLIVDRMEAAGEGALRAAFDALKKKLAAEGLFDDHTKQPLPTHPRHLTIISSASGAALHDVLHVIERRYPGLQILLIPSAVQGDAAEEELVEALKKASAQATDVVLLTRGGGSLEDLMAFNLETVARAVADCPHPVVSAIGHQTDFAITDFVADVRAPTPSAAAELITPTREELSSEIATRVQQLTRTLAGELRFLDQRLVNLGNRLIDPATRIALEMQQTDELEARMTRAWTAARHREQSALVTAARALTLLAPQRSIGEQKKAVHQARGRLATTLAQGLARRQLTLTGSARALSAVSPLNTMTRGYAVLTRADEDTTVRPISSVSKTAPGERLRALLEDGTLDLEVLSVDDEPPLKAPETGEEAG